MEDNENQWEYDFGSPNFKGDGQFASPHIQKIADNIQKQAEEIENERDRQPRKA
jgi:hypothetical protein